MLNAAMRVDGESMNRFEAQIQDPGIAVNRMRIWQAKAVYAYFTGDFETATPADSSAAILSLARPLPPAMIAPA